jgi:hypothetical protein
MQANHARRKVLSRTHLNVRELIKLPGFKGDPGEESTA